MSLSRRQIQLRRCLLSVLNDAGKFLMPEGEAMLIHVNTLCMPAATLDEITEVLAVMQENREVVRVETIEGFKTKLTDEGRAALM